MGDRNRALPFIPKILNLTLLLDVTPNQKTGISSYVSPHPSLGCKPYWKKVSLIDFRQTLPKCCLPCTFSVS